MLDIQRPLGHVPMHSSMQPLGGGVLRTCQPILVVVITSHSIFDLGLSLIPQAQ